jgi:hypothetical protein
MRALSSTAALIAKHAAYVQMRIVLRLRRHAHIGNRGRVPGRRRGYRLTGADGGRGIVIPARSVVTVCW